MFIKNMSLAVVCLFLINGCSITADKYSELYNKFAKLISSSEVIIVTQQNDSLTRDGQFSVVKDTVDESLKNIVNSYDISKEFKSSLGNRLKNVSWIKTKFVNVFSDPSAELPTELFPSLITDALVLIDTRYNIDEDLHTLIMRSDINIYMKSDDNSVPIYSNSVNYNYQLPDSQSDVLLSDAAWKIDNGAQVKRAINEGTTNLTNQIIAGLHWPYENFIIHK